MQTLARLLVATAALASAAGATAQQADAKKLKEILTGSQATTGLHSNCKLFTPAEIKGWLGAAVLPGEGGAGGVGCTWHDKDWDVIAYMSTVAARMHAEPSGSKTFKRLPAAIGPRAWVARDGTSPNAWRAGIVDTDIAIEVSLDGPGAGEASVVAFLKEAIQRRRR